jgi:YVTN family beta-propeller protein
MSPIGWMGRIGSGTVLVSLVAAVLGLTTTEASGQVTSRAFVSANAWDTLFELDSATLSTLSPGLGVATTPQAVAASPDGRRVYVTNETSGTVAMIEVGTWTVLANVFVASGVRGIAVSPVLDQAEHQSREARVAFLHAGGDRLLGLHSP